MIKAHYRADYAGEFVILETRWAGGQKQQTREWVPNPIENHHISGRAACIGSSSDRHKFDYCRLQRHRGGLLGSKKLQTYGVGSITNDMRLDFAVETQREKLKSLIEQGYDANNIVYTSASNCVAYPEKFYLIPYNPKLLDLSSLVYLAAFDRHQEIFLLGYNKDLPAQRPMWWLELVSLMNAYAGTKFYFVGESTNMYDAWLNCANASAMTYREFISYCDV
jgi:hypothetical protein